MSLEIVDRRGDGWLFAKIVRPRGQGRAFFQSLGTKNREDAARIAREAKLEQIQLAANADAITRDVWTSLLAGRKVRVRDSVAAFEEHRTIIGKRTSTIEDQQQIIDQFLRAQPEGFPNEQIAVVTSRHIADFINQAGDAKLSTRNCWLAALNGWLAYCFEKRWIVSNPCLEVRVRTDALTQQQLVTKSHTPFTDAEIARLLACIPPTDFWYGAVLIANAYGLRIGDVATLEYGNVVARRLRTFTRKGSKTVDEPLTDDVQAWLETWKAIRPTDESERLFPVHEAQYQTAPSRLTEQFAKWCQRAGIEGRTFAGLRKTVAQRVWKGQLSELGDKGQQAIMKLVAENGMKRVQQLLGHSVGSSVTENHYLK